MTELPHVDEAGPIRIFDVGDKAAARCRTLIDRFKAVDRTMEIGAIRVVGKVGGGAGIWSG